MSAHNVLHEIYQAPFLIGDPGNGGTIHVERYGAVVPVVTAGVETRTRAAPRKAGLVFSVVLDTDGGDLTLTVTGGYNVDGDTSITFGDAGDFVTFASIKIGANYRWRVMAQEGTNAGFDFSDNMTAGSGFTGTGTILKHSVTRVNGLIKTEILIDLTGLNGGGTNDDIIGKNGEANCHFGQITAAVNGTIFAGSMRCLELPAGGNVDIDLNTATIATGAEDADVKALTGYAQLLNAGNWANGTVLGLTANPAANSYLYLSNGAATGATYTAGILLIEFWGQ